MPRGRFNHVLLALLMVSAAVNVAVWRGTADTAGNFTAGDPAGDAGFLDYESAADREAASRTFDAVEKFAFLEDLEQRHLRRAREISDRYWSADGEYQSAYMAALAEGLRSIRDDLVSRYGAEVKDDPALHWLYRPLDPLYRFLTSDQQLAVQRLRLERDLSLQAAARGAGRTAGTNAPGAANAPGVAMGAGDAATLAIMQEYRAGLAALLDADTLLEFELRDSATAQQLRASGVDLAEDEFRQVYALMAGLQDASGQVDDVIETRDRLRSLLGSRRFALLWAARDPMYAEVVGIMQKHGLSDALALSVYEVMNGFQDQRMEIAGRNGRAPDRPASGALALADDEHVAIARLVGEEIADEIVRSRALLSYRLFGGSGRMQQDSVRQESQGGRFQ
jgi:hypothetical protein